MDNFIPRQYNYNFETGAVGTDDKNISAIYYDINLMEKKATFVSDDENVLKEALNEAFFLITDVKVHYNRFVKEFAEKLDKDAVAVVESVFSGVQESVRQAQISFDADVKCAALHEMYKKMLAVVPNVKALDDRSVGKI